MSDRTTRAVSRHDPGPMESVLQVRRATADDAAGIAAVLSAVVAERVHSAIDRAWSTDEERRFLETLTSRQAIHVAVADASAIIGLQILDLWSSGLESMAHVGQLGTFLLPGHRGRGIGRQLWLASAPVAREAGYRKLVVQVRASNAHARGYYRGLGFAECGRLTRQVVIDGLEDDEIIMELFL
jgi:ribosomal protein S18 acetylase RimI-like enzyme